MTLAVEGMLSVVAKVTVVTVLAFFATWLARRGRAAVRHALLAAALGVTLLLPIASVLVPPVRLAVPMAVENRAPAVEQSSSLFVPDPPDVHVISLPQSSRISVRNLLLAGWLGGSAIFLLPLVIGLWQIRLLRRSGFPWSHGQELADAIAREAGVHRRVGVLLHEEAPGPMACGVVRPAIVLPQDAESWSADDLSRAFIHEIEHVRRYDSVSHFVARCACAAYWFHPLVWIAWRRLALEAERSCDDAVLKHSDATAYADQLVGLAKRLCAAQRSPLVAMANRADLATRVRAVLDVRQRRGQAGAFSLGMAAASALVLAVSLASLILVAKPQAAPAPSMTPPPPIETAQVKPAPPRVVPQAAPQAKLEFEVASVKRVEIPSSDGRVPVFPPTGGIGSSDPQRITYRGTWLAPLIADAFGVRRDQIVGLGPVGNERYDIVANIPKGATKEQFKVMLGTLLRDRFHLRFHMDSKINPVYALRVAKNGPKLKATARRAADGTIVPGGIGAPDSEACPTVPPSYQGVVGWPSSGQVCWVGQDVLVEDLTRLIEQPAGRPVMDETGLTGRYDFKIRFESARRQVEPDGVASDPAPSIFNAVEELGLKLEPATTALPQLVIDAIDREPTEN